MTDTPSAAPPRRPEGNGLGPIGKEALQAAAKERGMFDPKNTEAPLPLDEFETDWQAFEKFARDTFESDLRRAHDKALEYGSHDLEIMATTMEALLPAGRLDQQSRHATSMEMAIGFYLMGKVSRMFGAWKKGTTPGDDSWRDGSIYSMMARYVRVNGKWIG